MAGIVTDAPARPQFHQNVFQIFEAATRTAAAVAPELEGVAVVALWRVPDQAGLPSALIVGADGPLGSPDQLARLAMATARLLAIVGDRYGTSLVRLKEVESHLARLIHEQETKLEARRTAADAPLPGAQGDQPDLDGADPPGGRRLGP